MSYKFEIEDKTDGQGRLHSESGPARVMFRGYSDDGNEIYTSHYYKHGKVHRDVGVSTVEFEMVHEFDQYTKIIKKEIHQLDGLIHRDDGPAIIEYDNTASIIKEIYQKQGRKHRIDKPAEIVYWPGTRIAKIHLYFNKGSSFRNNGVSWAHFDKSGSLTDYVFNCKDDDGFSYHGYKNETHLKLDEWYKKNSFDVLTKLTPVQLIKRKLELGF